MNDHAKANRLKTGGTASVASFCTETGFQNLPDELAQKAKYLILDYFGVTLAASASSAGTILKEYLNEVRGEPQATIIGSDMKVPCPEAAWVNGVLGHVLDFDDNTIELPAAIHTTVTVLPAALSVGETLEARGQDVMTAFVLGTEVACKIDRAIKGSGEKGFHGTGTFGTLGAAVAAGKLLTLSVEEMQHALGMAASMAGGLVGNFGTMTKPFHAGQASRNGVMAALLAKKGFTASKDILENTKGYGRVFGRGLNERSLKRSLGSPWEILEPGIHIKLYPACVVIHATIHAALQLADKHKLDPLLIDSIEVRTNFDPRGLFYSRPRTVMEGRFSPEFCVAIALLEGKCTLDEFTESKLFDSRVQQMIERIHVVPDANMKAPVQMVPASVAVKLKSGKELTETVEYPPGSGGNPLTVGQLEAKFRNCAKCAIPSGKEEGVIKAITNLENIGVKKVMSLLTP